VSETPDVGGAVAEKPPLDGSQKPRLSNYPTFFTTLGDDAIDLYEATGFELLQWEKDACRHLMGEQERSSRWSSPRALIIAPRQNGKNVIVEVRELAGLYLLGERKILHTAHEFKTAKDAFVDLSARIAKIEELEDMCLLPHRTSNEEVSIRLKPHRGERDPRYIRYLARTADAARGFKKVDLFVGDEAYAITHEQVAAFRPTQSAAPNRQFILLSSAGTGNSEFLAQQRNAGIEHTASGLLFLEYSADPEADLDDHDAWAIANPSYPIHKTHEFMLEERELQGEIQFAREHLGIWDDPRVNAVITPAMWEACKDESSQVLDPVAIAVDVTPDQAFSSIAIAGRREDGLPYVELVFHERGMHWVVETAARLKVEHEALGVVLDGGGQAGALIAGFREIGFEVEVTGARDMAQGAGAFYAEVEEERMRHNGEPDLVSAVAASRKRPVGDAWAWDRRDTSADISPLVACTLAWHGYSRLITADSSKRVRSGKVW
jgi:phage terminase large subunit-like protein